MTLNISMTDAHTQHDYAYDNTHNNTPENAYEFTHALPFDNEEQGQEQDQIPTQHDPVQQAQEKVEQLSQTLPDAKSVIESAVQHVATWDQSSLQFEVMQEAVFSAQDPAKIAYIMGKNPQLLQEMQTAKPIDIYRTIINIEHEIAAPHHHQPTSPNPPSLPPSLPPSPPSPIKHGARPQSKDPEKMNMKEWQAWRRKNLKHSL